MRELTGGELVEVSGGKGDCDCKPSKEKGSSKKGSSKKGSGGDHYRWGNGDSPYC